MLADVLDPKRLLAGELFPQPPLPLLERHLIRPMKPRNARLRVRLPAVFFVRQTPHLCIVGSHFGLIQETHRFQVALERFAVLE